MYTAREALKLAGPGAAIVARPSGVQHVYVGPLTQSGRFVPSTGRPLCRTHTRRLNVLERSGMKRSMTAPSEAADRTVCVRCSARLPTSLPGGRAELTTRDEFLRAHAHTSKADLAFALYMAETPAEVDAVGHLTLLRFGNDGCRREFTEHGRTWPSLNTLVMGARNKVRGYDEAHYRFKEHAAVIAEDVRQRRIAQRRQARKEREARIERIGFINATSR